jgi:Sec-independent protein translocase protein TatA
MLDNLLTPSHLAVILAITVLFFGGKKIPELGRGDWPRISCISGRD